MVQKIWEYVEQLHMIQKRDRVLVACSGGADSVALLRILWDRHKELGFEVEAVHVEHGIRGEESKRDENFVRELCLKDNIPFYCEHVDAPQYAKEHHLGLEEAARILRYQVFEKRADQINEIEAMLSDGKVTCASAANRRVKIALAHHEEDNVETVLFQMARGSGLSGMCGILPIREEGRYTYIRPLLVVNRQEIEAYLKEKGQSFCVDTTNADENYSRNFIRRELMPLLPQINEQAFLHVNQMTRQLSEIREYMESEVDKVWDNAVQQEEMGACSCEARYLSELMPAMQKALVMKMIAKVCGGRKDLTSSHVEAVLGILDKQTGARIQLPGNVNALMQYGRLLLYRDNEVSDEELVWNQVDGSVLERCRIQGQELRLDCGEFELSVCVSPYNHTLEEIHKKTYTKTLDYDKIKSGFFVRNRRKDDFLVIDEAGHHKSLRSYMIDEKIPSAQRSRTPLLAIENEIIWCIGKRISENYKVTEATNYVVHITYHGGSINGYNEA